jgi:threonine dehydratase
VITASAGNHGQALAYAARARGLRCEVFMPETAPIAKVEAARALGANVQLVGSALEESLLAAYERADAEGLAFVHPFDDPDIVAGQGSVGLELLEQVPDLAAVLVPVGGGGLASGIAIAVKSARPSVRVIGVQVETCAPFPASLRAGEPVAAESALTIADGIAVKRPGGLTLRLVKRWLDDVVVVGEDDIGEAMVFLLERTKLVVEGAGAVGVAALLGGRLDLPTEGTTAVILSGGNVDAGLLAQIMRRHESQAGRRLVVLARVPDRPGSLAQLLVLVGEQRANLLDVIHIREGLDLHVRETAVQLVLETRDHDHAERVVEAIRAAGYAEPRALR